MTTLLTSLPGDIPGLLRRCSPVVRLDIQRPGVVESIGQGWAAVAHDVSGGSLLPMADFALDLADPTARWQAAVWAEQATTYADVVEVLRHTEHAFYVEAIDAICRAKAGQMMSPIQIDTLARLVLRLAGRTA